MAEKSSVAEVKKIVGKRRTSEGVQYLVKWKGQGQKEYWVPFRHLQQSVALVKAYNQSNKVMQNGGSPSDQPKAANKAVKKPGQGKLSPNNSSDWSSPEKQESSGVLNLGLPTSPIMDSVRKSMDISGAESPPKQKRKYVRKLSAKTVKQLINGELSEKNQVQGPPSALNVIGIVKQVDPELPDMSKSPMSEPKPKRKYVRKVPKVSVNGMELISDGKGKVKKNRPLGKKSVKSGIRIAVKMPTTRKNMTKLVRKSIKIQHKSIQGKINFPVVTKENVNCSEAPAVMDNKEKSQKVKKDKIVKATKRKYEKTSSSKGLKVSGSLFSHIKSEGNRSNNTSDSEGMLYSLADQQYSSSDTEAAAVPKKKQKLISPKKRNSAKVLSKKKLVLRLTDLKHEWPEAGSTTTNSPDSDPEVSFKVTPRKLLLKDSIRPKSKPAKQNVSTKTVPKSSPDGAAATATAAASTKLPESPRCTSLAPATCTTPPRPTSPSGREPSPSLASTDGVPRVPPTIPILPSSPAAPRYEVLVKNMTTYFTKQGPRQAKHQPPVERRVSVRHSESAYKYKEIVVKKSQNFTQIWLFSQTKRKNSFNPKVFQELIQALHNAKFDDTRVVLLTGSGRVFCSGLDLHYLSDPATDRKVSARLMAESLRDFVSALASFPKPVVAAVNGPAVGLGVALLPLCDIVYASDKASFYCPYTRLGQTPEACATYTFPHAMGLAMANELLLAGRRITALEAYQIGLVSHVFWPTSMMQEVIPRMQQMASSSAKALEATKVLIRSHVHSKLQMSAETECQMLAELWATQECQDAIDAYIDDDVDMML